VLRSDGLASSVAKEGDLQPPAATKSPTWQRTGSRGSRFRDTERLRALHSVKKADKSVGERTIALRVFDWPRRGRTARCSLGGGVELHGFGGKQTADIARALRRRTCNDAIGTSVAKEISVYLAYGSRIIGKSNRLREARLSNHVTVFSR
jgi:hypothetical protein